MKLGLACEEGFWPYEHTFSKYQQDKAVEFRSEIAKAQRDISNVTQKYFY